MPDPFVGSVALFLAWLFGVAAYHKFRAPRYYQDLMSQMLTEQRGREDGPRWSAAIGPRFMGVVEAGLALTLLVPAFRRIGIIGGTALLVLYALFIGWQVVRGRRDLECGCAGPASGLRMSPHLVYRNLVCASLGGVALLPVVPVAYSTSRWFLSVAVACFMVATYLCAEQLILNGQKMGPRKMATPQIAGMRG